MIETSLLSPPPPPSLVFFALAPFSARPECENSFSRPYFWVYLGVKTCEVFLCLVAIVKVKFIMLTSLFSFFYVTGECHRFLH